MKKKTTKKSKKIKDLNLCCKSEHGIEKIKIPAEYYQEFIDKFGVLKIPERKDLLDWLYEEKIGFIKDN
jgi:hypothetical protein